MTIPLPSHFRGHSGRGAALARNPQRQATGCRVSLRSPGMTPQGGGTNAWPSNVPLFFTTAPILEQRSPRPQGGGQGVGIKFSTHRCSRWRTPVPDPLTLALYPCGAPRSLRERGTKCEVSGTGNQKLRSPRPQGGAAMEKVRPEVEKLAWAMAVVERSRTPEPKGQGAGIKSSALEPRHASGWGSNSHPSNLSPE